jgi:hypothetical protein
MSHPCDGHPCDHCYTCDVLGVCCMTVGSGASSRSDPAQNLDQRLRAALLAERAAHKSLRQLMQVDAAATHQGHVEGRSGSQTLDPATRVGPAALPPGPDRNNVYRRESHVHAPRSSE